MGSKRNIPGGVNTAVPATQWAPGFELMAAVAVSSTSTVTSETFPVAAYDNIGLQVAFSGTMTGTLSVNCSIDNVNWDALTFTPALTQPTGSSINYLISLNQLPFPYLQISYTNSSGSGTLTVFASAKDLN